MTATQSKFNELEKKVGPNKVCLDKATRIAHKMSHSPEIMLHKDRTDDFLPDAVFYAESTEDVVELVKFANSHNFLLDTLRQ